MKTLDEIKIEGWSKQKLYRRVVALEDADLLDATRGPANTILLDPLQESLLQRLVRLEDGSKRTGIAIEKLKYELTIQENEELRSKLNIANRQISQLNAVVERRKDSIIDRFTRWFRSLFGSKRETQT